MMPGLDAQPPVSRKFAYHAMPLAPSKKTGACVGQYGAVHALSMTYGFQYSQDLIKKSPRAQELPTSII